MKKLEVRLSSALYELMLADLRRPHEFAGERVGFAVGAWEPDAGQTELVLLSEYEPVSELDYIDDPKVVVRIGSNAIRNAMQIALDGRASNRSVFHVHLHDFPGIPVPSRIDAREIPPMVQSISRVSPSIPHGFLILSPESLAAWACVSGKDEFVRCSCFVSGSPGILVPGDLRQ